MSNSILYETLQELALASPRTLLLTKLAKGSPRERHYVQNTGRHPDSEAVAGTLASRLLNKTVDGFYVHIAAKIASHALRLLLRRRFGIDVLTF
jgi:hypothetical protein